MKEIKFCAWSESDKVMFYPRCSDSFMYLIADKPSPVYPQFKDIIQQGHLQSWMDKQEHIMQYTGKKDKNNKEIYADSTIFKFKYLEELYKPVELIGSFTFNEEDLRYEIDIYNHDRYIVLNYIGNGLFYDFEIIGTIQENPELIKEV